MSVSAERPSSSISSSVAFTSRRARFGCSAALAAIVALLLVGQGLARQAFEDSSDYPTLRAIGMTSRQLLALALIRAAAIGLVGARAGRGARHSALPALSDREPRPQGRARPRRVVDWLVVRLRRAGAVCGRRRRPRRSRRGAPPGRSAAPRRAHYRRVRPSPIAERLGRAGVSPTAVSGIRMALEPEATGPPPSLRRRPSPAP